MSELNSQKLMDEIIKSINEKPPRLGVDYYTPELHYAAIRVATLSERERIIELLEDYIPDFYELSANTDAGKYPIEHLIALIKGENK